MAIQAGRKGVKFDQVDLYGNVKPPEYELPIAGTDKLGAIKVGDNLSISNDGKLSAPAPYQLPVASDETLGGVKVGSGLAINNDGELENNYQLPTASDTTLGGVKVGAGLEINNGVLSVEGEKSYVMKYHGSRRCSSGSWNTINTDLTLPSGMYLVIISMQLPVNTDICLRSNVGSYSGGYGAGATGTGLADGNNIECVQYTDAVTVSSDTRLTFNGYITTDDTTNYYDYDVVVVPLFKLSGLTQVYNGTGNISASALDQWGSTSLTTLAHGKYMFLVRIGMNSGQDCAVKFSFNDKALNSVTATGRSSTSTNGLGVMALWIEEFTEDNNVIGLNMMCAPTGSHDYTVRIFKLDD